MKAHLAVSETGVASDPDSPLSFSMEGFSLMTPAAIMSSFWMPGWNSAQSITRFQEEVNGPLEGGDPGVRLIEPMPDMEMPYYTPSLAQSERGNALLAMPIYHIFGSEELSALAPAVAEMAPKPYVMLHPEDARDRGLGDGDPAAFEIGQQSLTAPVRVNASMARGIAGLPANLAGEPFMELPVGITVAKGRAL